MKVLFLAPHLSTGGMPAFLLKRIEALLGYTDVEIFVIEWKCYSMDYTVQRNKIEELLELVKTLTKRIKKLESTVEFHEKIRRR